MGSTTKTIEGVQTTNIINVGDAYAHAKHKAIIMSNGDIDAYQSIIFSFKKDYRHKYSRNFVESLGYFPKTTAKNYLNQDIDFSAIIPIKQHGKYIVDHDAMTVKANDINTLISNTNTRISGKFTNILDVDGNSSDCVFALMSDLGSPVYDEDKVDNEYIKSINELGQAHCYSGGQGGSGHTYGNASDAAKAEMVDFYTNIVMPDYKIDYDQIIDTYNASRDIEGERKIDRMLKKLNLNLDNFTSSLPDSVKDAYVMMGLDVRDPHHGVTEMLYKTVEMIGGPNPPSHTNEWPWDHKALNMPDDDIETRLQDNDAVQESLHITHKYGYRKRIIPGILNVNVNFTIEIQNNDGTTWTETKVCDTHMVSDWTDKLMIEYAKNGYLPTAMSKKDHIEKYHIKLPDDWERKGNVLSGPTQHLRGTTYIIDNCGDCTLCNADRHTSMYDIITSRYQIEIFDYDLNDTIYKYFDGTNLQVKTYMRTLAINEGYVLKNETPCDWGVSCCDGGPDDGEPCWPWVKKGQINGIIPISGIKLNKKDFKPSMYIKDVEAWEACAEDEIGDTICTPYSRIVMHYQKDIETVEQIIIYDLREEYLVSNVSVQTDLMHDIAGDRLRMILPLDLMNQLRYKDFVAVYERSLHLMAHSTQSIRVKWYQQSWFSSIIRIIMVVVSIALIAISFGSDTAEVAELDATLAGMLDIQAGTFGYILVNSVAASLTIKFIVQQIMSHTSGDVGIILSAITGLLVGAVGIGLSFESETWLKDVATSLMSAVNYTNQAISIRLTELSDAIIDGQQAFDKKIKDLEDEYGDILNKEIVNPFSYEFDTNTAYNKLNSIEDATRFPNISNSYAYNWYETINQNVLDIANSKSQVVVQGLM